MNIYLQAAERLEYFRELKSAVKSGATPASVTGLSAVHKAHAALYLAQESSVLFICPDEASAVKTVADINELAGSDIASLYPVKDFSFANIETASPEYEHRRIGALHRVLSGKARVLACSVEAAMQSAMPPDKLSDFTLSFTSGETIDTVELSALLTEMGYSRSPQTEGRGQFSVRGSIIDIYPVGAELPYRIELWGDEIDTISLFDTDSQRRIDTVREISVTPAKELLIPNEELISKIEQMIKSASGKHADAIKKNLYADLDSLKSGIPPASLDKYYSQIYGAPATVFDYFNDGICIISEYTGCLERAKAFSGQLQEDIKILYEDGILFKETTGFYSEFPQIMSRAEKMRLVYLDMFMRGSDVKLKSLTAAEAYQSSGWSGETAPLFEELHSYVGRGCCTVLLSGSEKARDVLIQDVINEGFRCQKLSEDSELSAGTVYVGTGGLSGGFEYPAAKFAVITRTKANTARRRSKQKPQNSKRISSIADITPGDLVVHTLHGIGRFSGISSIETNGVTKDYITIKYAGSDVLYVPVTQLDTVSKYIAPGDDEAVKLNRLGTQEWTRTRARIKKACRDMADELIALYAKRQLAKGYQFSPDNDWQAEFEERFEYEETADQLRSIDEIKADMMRPVPMDRLLCGDVGFGKTEVALRAAMKCVLDSKQCAIMVPTTVLAWQHYQTATRRFSHFPVNIELLSRFRTQKQQKEIVEKLARGEVDLVIGTHRLVQNDVKFKNLGLLIIDEEQRFGVAHKEKLKEQYPSVDILTLSATPIPRTLNMAMSGIRDMSVIEEPPQDRYPVQTYVLEHQQGIIIQAIQKELRRGGQVYYIHNRIETLEMCAYRLSQQLPDARIGIAHGQMEEEKLSDIWRQLLENEIDILVCTTIIETGVDVPNVNTLIIEDADRFGLSQLYQLRGRVGRSNRRAYAYFTFRRGKVITEIAAKRLEAIRELTQFGSGFKVAMRDLEIRGVGSILSAKQHGHMEAVGYDMYLRLLTEAIAEQKGEPPPKAPEDCLVDISIDAFIPEDYIEDLSLRIDAYRKIARIVSVEDSEDVIDELIDRFGEPPKSVTGLINVALLRNMASNNGIKEISQKGDFIYFYIREANIPAIMAVSQAYKGRIKVDGTANGFISVKLKSGEAPIQLMKGVLGVMDGLGRKGNEQAQ